MEELSIKEKAERYDELLVKLQKAKIDNNVCDERYCCVIDDIVPEFKESEDERIRKKLIEAVKGDMVVGGTKDKQLAIAWLDKQGEKKTAWSEEDEREIEHCIDFLNHPDMIRTTPTVVKGCKNWLKDLKDRVQPQTTWKPSDEHIHGLIWVINRMPDIKKANEAEAVLRDLLEQLNKLRKE